MAVAQDQRAGGEQEVEVLFAGLVPDARAGGAVDAAVKRERESRVRAADEDISRIRKALAMLAYLRF
jgi:hypothetical protein